MTKKAEHEARVAANKKSAWVKKFRTLVGHVLASSLFERIGTVELNAAYDVGMPAEEFAARIASREPVGQVVHALKVQAIASAEERAQQRINEVTEELAANGWDREKVAPYPESNLSRVAYVAALDKYNLIAGLTESTDGSYSYRGRHEPKIVRMSEDGMVRFIQRAKETAVFQYDMFICKLVQKVGPCDSASLDGSHVWSHSILTVKKGDATERWHTQQIWNRSVLGLDFQQWPTRLMNAGKQSGRV